MRHEDVECGAIHPILQIGPVHKLGFMEKHLSLSDNDGGLDDMDGRQVQLTMT